MESLFTVGVGNGGGGGLPCLAFAVFIVAAASRRLLGAALRWVGLVSAEYVTSSVAAVVPGIVATFSSSAATSSMAVKVSLSCLRATCRTVVVVVHVQFSATIQLG